VARGPLAGDARYYYTGDGEPRMTTVALAIQGMGNDYPKVCYALGVPAPAQAPTVSVTGGTSPTESRAYRYTYVTAMGEESAPSPASAVVTGNANGSWTVALPSTGPANSASIVSVTKSATAVTVQTSGEMTYRVGAQVAISGVVGMTDLNGTHTITDAPAPDQFVVALATAQTYTSGGTVAMVAPWNTTGMTKRIYRTVTGAAGETKFQLVDEVPVATTSYTDAVTTPGEVLATKEWALPPGDLQGIVSLPNGGLAGFSGNQLCYSEPDYPHAWPEKYRHQLDCAIVALGPFDRSIAIATTSTPYVATGTDPAQVSLDKIDEVHPCVSAAGAARFSFGLMFPTRNGLVLLGSGGLRTVTTDLSTGREWKTERPETLIAAAVDGAYYALHQPVETAPYRLLIINRNEPASFLKSSVTADALYCNHSTGNLYLVVGNKIYQWDANRAERLTFFWRSKDFVFPEGATVAAARIDTDFAASQEEIDAAQADFDAAVASNALWLAANAIVNGAMNWRAIGAAGVNDSDIPDVPRLIVQSLSFVLYADGEEIAHYTIQDKSPFTLPDGYKANTVSIAVGGNIRVRAVVFGPDALSLARA